ncbi:MAG TPA: VOC family protein [Capsulimonadaceae bacterium]|nr:VOC family protein [Capsulimonadaceae bacterium]
MHAQPLICVRDVEASSRWYQRLLGVTSAHGGAEYERLNKGDTLILQLHNWEVKHHHDAIGDPDIKAGNGVLLWFEIADLAGAVARSKEMNVEVVMPHYHHAGASQWEIWLRDPDGYTVVLSEPDGTRPGVGG